MKILSFYMLNIPSWLKMGNQKQLIYKTHGLIVNMLFRDIKYRIFLKVKVVSKYPIL